MDTLYIAQKMFSLWGKYDVKNSAGQLVYTVKGELSMTKKMGVFDAQGQRVGEIRQAMISLTPRFEIYEYGKKIGEIHKDITLFRPKYTISMNNWRAEGDLMGWNYSVYAPGHHLVGKVHKELFHLTDHYAIDFDQPQDALPMLMLALAIDAVNEAEANSKNSSNNQNNNHN